MGPCMGVGPLLLADRVTIPDGRRSIFGRLRSASVSQPTPHPENLLERAVAGDEPVDPQTSLELLRCAQAGERAALEALILRCQDRLRRIVRIQLGGSILRQHYDSMDIVQGTFEAALPKIAELKAESAGALLQWLSVVATNQVRDAYAHELAQKRDARRTQRLSDSHAGRPGSQVAALGALPDDHALLAEVRELLDDEVARLPEAIAESSCCATTAARAGRMSQPSSGARAARRERCRGPQGRPTAPG